MALFAGLCTGFSGVVTAYEAWQEHLQSQWPEVTAKIESCDMVQASSAPRQYYIDCRLSYSTGGQKHVAEVYSRNVPPPGVWQYPRNQMAPYVDWVNDHLKGTPIAVRYDPVRPGKIALAWDYMPGGGPRTAGNIELTGLFAGGSLVLLVIARMARPRSSKGTDYPSMPLDS